MGTRWAGGGGDRINLNKGIFVMTQMNQTLQNKEVIKVYYAFFHSFLSYGNQLWANELNNKELCRKVFRKQKRAIRILIFGRAARKQTCRGRFRELGILTCTSIFILQSVIYALKYLKSFNNEVAHSRNTRNEKLK